MIRIHGDVTPEKKRIAAEVKRTVGLFVSLDIRRVESACNQRREEMLRAIADCRDDERLDKVYPKLAGFDGGTARRELLRPFRLVEPPQSITIELRYDLCDAAPNTAAFVIPDDPAHAGMVYVLAGNVDADALCAKDTRGPLLDYVLHEMLHLCGDAKKEEDGIIRMQFAGSDVVKELLGPRLA